MWQRILVARPSSPDRRPERVGKVGGCHDETDYWEVQEELEGNFVKSVS